MNETVKLAHFCSSIRYQDLPKEVVEKAKDIILDQLGVELASSTLPWSHAIYRYVRDSGEGRPDRRRGEARGVKGSAESDIR